MTQPVNTVYHNQSPTDTTTSLFGTIANLHKIP